MPRADRGGGRVTDSALYFDSQRAGHWQLYRMDLASGASARVLSSDADDFWPKRSPDRTRLVWHRAPRGVHDLDFTRVETWGANADGSSPRRLLRAGAAGNEHSWLQHGHVEWRPDGRALLFTVFDGSWWRITETDTRGRNPRHKTPQGWHCRDGAYWPDQSGIVCVVPMDLSRGEDAQDIWRQPNGGPSQRLTDDGYADWDPSPDPRGAHVAWLRRTGTLANGRQTWDVFVSRADGSAPRNLTGNAPDAPYGAVNSKPCWSRDGRLLYFHRARYGLDDAFRLWRVDPFAPTPHDTLAQIDAGQPGPNEYPDA